MTPSNLLNNKPIDLSEFEPRPSTPVRARLSPDKRPISSLNSPLSPQRNAPFTPVRKSVKSPFSPRPFLSPKLPLTCSSTPIPTATSNPSPTPTPSSTPTPTPNSTPTPSPFHSNQLIHLDHVLLHASTLKPRARITAEAIPRKKQILPGAPNPSPLTPTTVIFPRNPHSPPKQTQQIYTPPSEQVSFFEEDGDPEEGEKVEENVLVTIRLRPGLGPSIWNVDRTNAKIWEQSSSSETCPGPDSCFDAVFGPECSNQDVYQFSAAHQLIRSTMKGYDSTIFAYGQTASGKTFTLTGDPHQPGIIPLAVTDIFEFIRAHPNRDFLLRASYLEIYNEQINDLLIPPHQSLTKPAIKIRQDASTKHFYPSPIREEVVTTEFQVSELLARGGRNRHVSGTDWNARSSRSHTVFSIVVESRKAGRSDGIVRRSRVCLIDLAGSERAASDGTRRAEGAFINKSLLTLEKVIGALSKPEGRTPTQHVPFRDSKLTQILQPSLSGDAKVCVICTLNPSSAGNALDESRGTLRFARRVKKVSVKTGVKEILSERALITRYRQQIVQLQCQLNQAVSAAKTQPTTNATSTGTTTPTDESKAQQSAEAEAQRNEILGRLNKLQSIVLNAANLDREQESVARPVSPMKQGSRGLFDDVELEEEELKALTLAQAETIEDLRTELETYKRTAAPDLVELAELKVIVSNLEPEISQVKFGRRLKLLEEENRRRKAFGEEMVALLEAAQTKAKQLELFIINELKTSVVKSRQRPRRSSIGTYLPSVQPGHEGDRLLALVNEGPEVRCVRASFGNVEIDLDG